VLHRVGLIPLPWRRALAAPWLDVRSRLAGPGLLLVVAMAFFRHLLPPDRALYLRDLSFEVLPFRRHVGEMVAAGTAPWWTPLVFGGAPTVAMVHGLFYPPSAVFFLLPAPWALKVFIVGHDLIAGLGLWALLRALAVSPVAALLGATTYMLSGYVLSLGNLVNLLVGAAWLPWAILCFVRATEGAGPVWGRWAILTGVVLGLQALADVQSAYLTVAILVFGSCFRGDPGGWRGFVEARSGSRSAAGSGCSWPPSSFFRSPSSTGCRSAPPGWSPRKRLPGATIRPDCSSSWRRASGAT
jgi:hypothetical protein